MRRTGADGGKKHLFEFSVAAGDPVGDETLSGACRHDAAIVDDHEPVAAVFNFV